MLIRLVVVLLLLIVTPMAGRAQPLTPVVVAAVRNIDCTPFYYALQQGLFEKAGLEIGLEQQPAGAGSVTAVVAGAASIGFANTLSLITAHTRGIPIVLIAPGELYQTKAPNVALLAPRDGPVRSLKDLAGRSIAIPGLHDLLAFSTMSLLEHAGVSLASVRFVELTPGAMAAALQAKRVDAVSTYDPFVDDVADAGGAVIGRPSLIDLAVKYREFKAFDAQEMLL